MRRSSPRAAGPAQTPLDRASRAAATPASPLDDYVDPQHDDASRRSAQALAYDYELTPYTPAPPPPPPPQLSAEAQAAEWAATWGAAGSARPGAPELPANFLSPALLAEWEACVTTAALPRRPIVELPPLPAEQSVREAWPVRPPPAEGVAELVAPNEAEGRAAAERAGEARAQFDRLRDDVRASRAQRPRLRTTADPTPARSLADLLGALTDTAASGGGQLALRALAEGLEAERGIRVAHPGLDGAAAAGPELGHGGGAPVDVLRQSVLQASLDGVKALVRRLWGLTHRLSAECMRGLLVEMFSRVAEAGPAAFASCLQLWVRMLQAERARAAAQREPPFLDEGRLALVGFRHVFLSSQALGLAVAHAIARGGAAAGVDAAASAAVWAAVGELLRETFAPHARQLVKPMVAELSAMAQVAHGREPSSLVVSSATMDMDATARVVADVVLTFVDGAVPDAAREAIGAAVDDLNRTMLLQVQLGAQLDALLAAYARAEAPACRPEADLLRALLAVGTPKELRHLKTKLAPAALVVAPPLDGTIRALNAVKTRVLGAKCDLMDADVLLAIDAPGARPGTAAAAAAAAAREAECACEYGVVYVDVRQVRGLRPQMGEVLALVQCGREKAKSGTRRCAAGADSAPLKYGCRFSRVKDTATVTILLLSRSSQRAVVDQAVGSVAIRLGDFAKATRKAKASAMREYAWLALAPPLGFFGAGRAADADGSSSAHGGAAAGACELEVQVRFERFGAQHDDEDAAAELSRRLSGVWTGQAEHGRTSQVFETTLAFGLDGVVRGSGVDLLGAFELVDGTIAYAEDCKLAFTKRYTGGADGGALAAAGRAAANAAKAARARAAERAAQERAHAVGQGEPPLAGTPRETLAGAPAGLQHLESGSAAAAAAAAAAASARPAPLPAEVFFEGRLSVDRQTIEGQWHLGYSVSAVRQRETGSWHAVEVAPLPARALAFQLRLWGLWEHRDELVARAHAYATDRLGLARAEDMSDEHWAALARTIDYWDADGADVADADDADRPRRRGTALRRLYAEAAVSRSRVHFLPRLDERTAPDAWTHAKVVRPSLSIEGSFVLWPKGIAAHRILPHLNSALRTVSIPPPRDGKRRAPPQPPQPRRAQALILNVAAARELLAPAHLGGDAALLNPYVELTIGGERGVRLLTRPVLRTGSASWSDERFVVMLDGPLEGLGELPVRVRVKHRLADAVGGPPVLAAELDVWVEEVLSAALEHGETAEAKLRAARAANAASGGGGGGGGGGAIAGGVVGDGGGGVLSALAGLVFGGGGLGGGGPFGGGGLGGGGGFLGLGGGGGVDAKAGRVWRFPPEARRVDETLGTGALLLAQLLEPGAHGGLPDAAAGGAGARHHHDATRAAVESAAELLGAPSGRPRYLQAEVRVSVRASDLLRNACVPARLATRSLERISAALPAARALGLDGGGGGGAPGGGRALSYALERAQSSTAVSVHAAHAAALAQRAHGVLGEAEIASVMSAALGDARVSSGVVTLAAAYLEWEESPRHASEPETLDAVAVVIPVLGGEAFAPSVSAPRLNPYDVPARRSALLRYGWEKAEKAKVLAARDAVGRALDTDRALQWRLVELARNLSLRVHGRQLEHAYAQKRADELELLDCAGTFVATYAVQARLLRPARAPLAGSGALREVGNGGDVGNLASLERAPSRPFSREHRPVNASVAAAGAVRSVFDLLLGRNATVGADERQREWADLTGGSRRFELMAEDEACVVFMEGLVRVQHALAGHWLLELREQIRDVQESRQGRLRRRDANASGGGGGGGRGQGYADYAKIRDDLDDLEGASLAVGSRESQVALIVKERLRLLALLEAHDARIEERYNALLRKLHASKALVQTLGEALELLLPVHHRWVRTLDKVAIYAQFAKWTQWLEHSDEDIARHDRARGGRLAPSKAFLARVFNGVHGGRPARLKPPVAKSVSAQVAALPAERAQQIRRTSLFARLASAQGARLNATARGEPLSPYGFGGGGGNAQSSFLTSGEASGVDSYLTVGGGASDSLRVLSSADGPLVLPPCLLSRSDSFERTLRQGQASAALKAIYGGMTVAAGGGSASDGWQAADAASTALAADAVGRSRGYLRVERVQSAANDIVESLELALRADPGLGPARVRQVHEFYVHVTVARGAAPAGLRAGGGLMIRPLCTTVDGLEVRLNRVALDYSNRLSSTESAAASGGGGGGGGGFFGWLGQLGSQPAAAAELLAPGRTDVFHVEFGAKLDEVVGAELLFGGARGGALVGAPLELERLMLEHPSSGRSWLLHTQAPSAQALVVAAARRSAHAGRWSELEPEAPVSDGDGPLALASGQPVVVRAQATFELRVAARVGDGGNGVLGELQVRLHGARGVSGPITLSERRRALGAPPAATPSGRRPAESGRFLVHFDDHGRSLDALGPIRELEVVRQAAREGLGGGAAVPLLLQHVSVWARHTNQVSHFEWNDWVFSRAHALLAHDAHAADDAACAHTFRPQSTWAGLMLRAADTHICLPPAAPSAPEMRLLPLPAGAAAHDGGSAQLLRLSWRAAASADMGWAADCRWLVEFAAERGGGLDVFVEEVPTGADRRVGLSVEPPAAAGGPTTYHLDLSLGKLLARLSVGRLYLWRVSLVHASFGRGAFSPPTRMALGRAADGSGAYALQCAPLASRRLHELGGAAAWRPRPFDAVRARVQMGGSQAAVGARGASRRVTFAQAVASGALQLCGDAEVAAGAIELTPMRKAVGLVGAAWSTRPVRIADGFETEFVVTCTRPADALGADGLAFVLHADPAGARALGGAGLQLGYSGLVDCIAIQLVTNPSYAGAAATAGAKGGGGDDGGDRSHEIDDEVPSELCVIESNNQVIRVPLAWSGRACIDPYTGIQFKAPSFGTRRSHRRRAHAGPGASASTSGDAAKKRSHLHNTVALQAAEMGGPNSPRADCTLARATLTHTQLDDGRPKRVRIILERSRFERGAHTERGGASGVDAMRLVVYVADLHDAQSHTQAVINMELDLSKYLSAEAREKGTMFAGFTASTGRLYEAHTVSDWAFYEVASSDPKHAASAPGPAPMPIRPDPPPNPAPAGSVSGVGQRTPRSGVHFS